MGWVVNATPRPLYPRERPDTHCIGGWVSPRAGLEGCGKSRPGRDSIPGPSSPQRVAVPIANTYIYIYIYIYIHTHTHTHTGYTQKNGAFSISWHVGKLVVTPAEHKSWRLHSTTWRCSPHFHSFSIVFFNSAGSDVLHKETTTFSLSHPVRRI